jgi:enoyl-[acyl-carrier protein] reductase II
MEAAIPLSGQVCGRIDAILSAEEVVQGTMEEFHRTMKNLARAYA